MADELEEPPPEGMITARRSGNTVYLVMAAAAVGVGFIVADHLTTPFDDAFESAAKANKLDPNLLRAIGKKESRFRPDAVSAPNQNGSRDYGVMQINDSNFRTLGLTQADSLKPVVNINAAARLLVKLKSELGDKLTPQTLVAAYNAGAPAIKSRGIFNQSYVAEVMTHYQLFALGRVFQK